MTDYQEALKAPFPVEYIEWKPQATTRDNTKALAVAYADTRAYEDRLNDVCGEMWWNSIDWNTVGDKIICTVTIVIEGTSRSNVGESPLKDDNAATIAYAQAFKRACSSFGLGRYLYDLPRTWVDYDESRRKITDEALEKLNSAYERRFREAPDDAQTVKEIATAKPAQKARQPVQSPAKSEPGNITELYTAAKEQLSYEVPDAVNILMKHIKEQHGMNDIGTFLKAKPDNIKELWQVLLDDKAAESAALSV